MSPRLGVLGWPVAHSRSPAMHNAALHAVGLGDWRYQRLPVPPHLFDSTTRALSASAFIGANVTIPHKGAALALSDEASPSARAIGAANTLTFAEDGTIAAENTDAPGLIAALAGAPEGPHSPRGQSVQILGAGGSARAAAWALREAGAREVMVWNRTATRAEALAGELGVRAVGRPQPASLLVNCTSVGLQGPGDVQRSASQIEALNQLGLTFDQLGEYTYVVDLVYQSRSTPLLAAAHSLGLQTLDGLDVLAAQGALSFALWTEREAPVELMRSAARAEASEDR